MAHPNYRKIEEWLESEGIHDMIKSSLPSSIDTDAWINSAKTHIGSDKDVLEADPQSTLGSVLEAATLGVRFEGPLGEAYLEARSSKYKDEHGNWQWRKLTQLQIQYRGLMKLARRDPLVRKVEAIIVHENDFFEHQLGSNQFLNHTWDVRKPRGKGVAVYAALRYHDGFYDFGQPYPMDAIIKHRDQILGDKRIRVETHSNGTENFYKKWNDNEPEKLMTAGQIRRIPWITYLPAMAQKTAVRWSAKFWDLSPDFDRAAGLVAMVESGRDQGLLKRVEQVVPKEMLDGEGEAKQPRDTGSQGTQVASLNTMGTLKERMVAESGVGQGEMDGPPPETEEPPAEKVPAEESSGEMSEEEKQAALDLEKQEAAEFFGTSDKGEATPKVTKPKSGNSGRKGNRKV